MITDVIERFSKGAPVAVMFRGVFVRMFAPKRLDQIFRDHKVQQVESEILFSSLVRLLTPVIYGGKRSVLASFTEHEKELGVSKQAFYDKLKGVEAPVSAALVREPAVELGRILSSAKATRPDIVPGYHTFIIDGKRLDGTEHRLEETRHTNSSPLPGTVLTLLDTRLGIFVDAACHPDAYVCERKVVGSILERAVPGALYMADRNFSDGPLIDCFLRRKAFFLLRQHGSCPSWRQIPGCEPRVVGKDSRGNVVSEQTIEVALPDRQWVRVRRITLKLKQPTKKGESELHLLTNLPDSVSAIVLADAYGQRWTIEICLGHVAQSLNAEINTLAYPGAAMLCFCLGLVLFNIISALKTLVETHAAKPVPPLSHYYMAMEIAEARKGIEIMVDRAYWDKLATWPLPKFVSWLKSLISHVDLDLYRANPRGPKKPRPKRRSGKNRTHVSTHRLLELRHC